MLAGRYAEKLGENLSEHEVRSVAELQHGKNRNVDSSRSDDYAKHFLGKLQDKRYWEVCYRTVERMLGGDQCYYIDKDSRELLVVYRGQ